MDRSCLKIMVVVFLFSAWNSDALGSYAKAQRSFKGRDYVSAAPEFFNVMVFAKNQSQRRKTEWGLAQSLHKLGLFYSASKYYTIIVRRGRKSSNPFFRKALEALGKIDRQVSLGQSHVEKVFKAKVRTADVPGAARGFYFYYKGVAAFSRNELENAGRFFSKVPGGSPYNLPAIFHQGVVANLSGRSSRSISKFQKVLRATSGDRNAELYESALINIARVHYEQKRYTQAITFYGRIPRDSGYWLDAIWETAWAFFFLQKFNNTLGQIHTIHSPFFSSRFYPESYILQAITFMRLCRFPQVKKSMKQFKVRYKPMFKSVNAMLNRFKRNPRGFFKFVNRYNNSGRMRRFDKSEEVIKKLTKVDAYKEARDIIRFSQREIEALGRFKGRWSSGGLQDDLKTFLRKKKGTAVSGAGRNMYKLAREYYALLLDLSNQTKLIVAEMQLGRLATLRERISAFKQKTKVNFIGGMQQLNIGQSLEYWPFEKEYWEDELGFYVYNLGSRCKKEN